MVEWIILNLPGNHAVNPRTGSSWTLTTGMCIDDR